MTTPLERRRFLQVAVLVEGGLILLAAGLAWGLEIFPSDLLAWNTQAVLWGLGATLPLLAVFGVIYFWPVGSYRRIKDFLLESLGPSIAACRWYELFFVAMLAGVGEELLFRGVLQIWMAQRWGEVAGLFVSNLLFGFCHAVTVTYVLLAFCMGVYFGLLMDAPAERSLLSPMIAHGLYDFVAFLVVAADWRKRRMQHAPGPAAEEQADTEQPAS